MLKHAGRETLIGASSAQAAGPPGWNLHTARGNAAREDLTGLLIAGTLLGYNGLSPQHIIHRIGHIAMDNHFFPALLFDDHIKGGRSFTLKNTFLRMTTTRLLVTQCHGLDTANQVGESR